MGVVLSAVNPKNLLLTVGAAAAIAQTGTSAGGQAVALAVFIVLGSIGTGVPVLIYFALGERAREPLEELKGWMAANKRDDHDRAVRADRGQADRQRNHRPERLIHPLQVMCAHPGGALDSPP
jgi:Sap-like sulfolipid-1-addressing protein